MNMKHADVDPPHRINRFRDRNFGGGVVIHYDDAPTRLHLVRGVSPNDHHGLAGQPMTRS